MEEFIRSLQELTLAQIVERISALDVEVRAMTDVTAIDEATKKKAALLERKAYLDDIEKRKADALKLQSGIVEPGNIIERGGMEMPKTYAVDTPEYRSAYLRDLQGKEISKEERAAITATKVIPTQTLNMIVEKLEQTSALYSSITVLNIPGSVSIPVENAKADAAFVAMGTAATDSADSFDSVDLGAYKLIKTIEITADVMAMSIDAFESFIVDALYKKMMKAIENAILNGTGASQPTGLLKAGEITQTATFTKAAMTYPDLLKVLGLLPTAYSNGAKITMNRKLFYGEVLGLVDANKKPIVVQDVQNTAKYNLLGYPVVVNDLVPDDTIVFGDFSYYYLNWAMAPEIKSDESVGFRSGSTVYRSLALVDGKKAIAEAFVVATRAAS